VVRRGEISLGLTVPVSARALATLVDAASGALTHRTGPETADEHLTALYERILRPVRNRLRPGDTIIFVPDKSLYGVPFAALRDPGSHRYLIENHALAVAPSASFYAALARSGSVEGRQQTGRHCGRRPAFKEGSLQLATPPRRRGGGPVPCSPSSPAAGSLLPGLLRRPQRLLRELGRRGVVHVAAHALLDGEHPTCRACCSLRRLPAIRIVDREYDPRGVATAHAAGCAGCLQEWARASGQ